jgi:predicted nuclease of predicted toxin-antitoxin system
LLDENLSEYVLTNLLRKAGYDVIWFQQIAPYGSTDENVLSIAQKEKRVLYTRDRDFFRLSAEVKSHSGIIFEYRNNESSHMSRQQILNALGVIAKRYSSLKNQIIIINSFRQR